MTEIKLMKRRVGRCHLVLLTCTGGNKVVAGGGEAKQAAGRDTDDRAGISRRCFGDGIAGCELKR